MPTLRTARSSEDTPNMQWFRLAEIASALNVEAAISGRVAFITGSNAYSRVQDDGAAAEASPRLPKEDGRDTLCSVCTLQRRRTCRSFLE